MIGRLDFGAGAPGRGFGVFDGDPQEAGSLATVFRFAGFSSRTARGRRMRRLPGLIDELAAVWQFPLGFRETWEGLARCLSSGLGAEPGGGYVTVLLDPGEVLVDEPAAHLAALVATLSEAMTAWAGRGVPFGVVLSGEDGAATRARPRWEAAGARLIDLPSHRVLLKRVGVDPAALDERGWS
ncbi:MAG: hypothetical protein LBO20_10640 [Bifidobacteriaceae bacterium]|jgi:hypothetical protein|nr:hypothetical protein [Bifidobacteriaceae bacterium]